MNSTKKLILFLGLSIPITAYAVDKLIYSPTGNLILDAETTSSIKANKQIKASSLGVTTQSGDLSLNATTGIVKTNGVFTGNGSGLTSLNAGNISTGTLAVARGGTNSSTALSNNRVIQSSGGAIVEAAAITANRALISDSNGIPTQSATTNTQLGYLSSATGTTGTPGNLVFSASPTLSGTITGGTFSGTHTGNGSGLTSLDAGNISSGTLPIARGGTNSSTTLNNNRVIKSSGSAIVEAAAITANRALISDSNGIPTQSGTTSTQLGYLSGATGTTGTTTSNIVFSAGPTFSGTVKVDTITNVAGTDSPNGGVPVGTVVPYAGSTAPTGWFLAYGQAVSRTTYSNLFAIICPAGNCSTWGVGDGVNTFNLPDLRGRVAGGKDNMGGTSANRMVTNITGGTLGATGGDESITLSATQIPLLYNATVSISGEARTSGQASGSVVLGSTSEAATVDISHDHSDTSASGGTHFHYHNVDDNGTGAYGDKRLLGSSRTGGVQLKLFGDGEHSHNIPSYSGTKDVSGINLEHTHSNTVVTGNTGTITVGTALVSQTSVNNLPPTIILNYIIKY